MATDKIRKYAVSYTHLKAVEDSGKVPKEFKQQMKNWIHDLVSTMSTKGWNNVPDMTCLLYTSKPSKNSEKNYYAGYTMNSANKFKNCLLYTSYIKDSDMEELSRQVLRKLDGMTDKEFAENSLEAVEE